jgi:hypothetical protein
MSYGVKASEYLARAQHLIGSNAQASFFYAAFELRCGIEARLKEYFDAQAETTAKRRAGWQIDKLAKQVESVFELGSNKGYRMTVFEPTTEAVISAVIYTPVTRQLQKFGERLGGYLHSQNSNRLDELNFWVDLKKLLGLTAEELAFACSGTLMGPPLVHPQKPGERFFSIDGDQRKLFPAGKQIGWRYEVYEIEYLDEPDSNTSFNTDATRRST